MEISAHGASWTDEYAWLRAENWQEALRDPAALAPDIRTLLETENAYADAALASTANLQKTLVAEMRARIQEDDSQPPQADGPWAYYSRFRPGGQHRIFCRRPRDGGEEAILIDGDALAAGKAFFSLATARHAPDHAKLAWGADELGSETPDPPRARSRHGAGPRRPRGQRRARHRLDARRDRVPLCRAGRKPPAVPRDAAPARDG